MSPRSHIAVRFQGPIVEREGVPLDDLVGVLTHFQRALVRQIEAIAGRASKPGRIPDAIRSAGSLVLTGTSRGSLVAELELAEPAAGALPDFGAQALDQVLEGMERPQHLLPAVRREILLLQESLREGLDSVEFSGGTSQRRSVISRQSPLDVETIDIMPTPPRMHLSGRILVVDWKDGTAELHTPQGMTRLAFDESLADVLRDQLSVSSVSDDEIKATLRQDFASFGFATCPHTATATHTWRNLDPALTEEHDWIMVATAHPAKFETIVEPLIGEAIPLPPDLEYILARPASAVSIDPTLNSLAAALQD